MNISMCGDFYPSYDQQISEIRGFGVFETTKDQENFQDNRAPEDLLPSLTRIPNENRRSLCRLIYYFPQKNQDKMNWKSIENFIKTHNNGLCYSARTLLYFSRNSESCRYRKEFSENERTISEEELIDLAKSLNIGREGCESSNESSSFEELSQTGRLRNLWTDLEREVLRKVMSDYKMEYSSSSNVKWSDIARLFNRIIQEKDSSRPERDSRRICEQWQNFESPYVVTGKIPEKHVEPLCRLISYFSNRNTGKKMSWSALRDFIKEHNSGYYYSDNALKLCDRNSKNQEIKNSLKEEAEMSEEEAVTIAKSLQLELQSSVEKSAENGRKRNCTEEMGPCSLKKRALRDEGLDAFTFDPSLWFEDKMELSYLPK